MHHEADSRPTSRRLHRLLAGMLAVGATGAMSVAAATGAGAASPTAPSVPASRALPTRTADGVASPFPAQVRTGTAITHARAAATGPLTNPAANVPPSSSTWLVAIDSARAGEGVGPVPAQLAAIQALPAAEQVFAITNFERVGRGLAPIQAMLTSLNGAALVGANGGKDPVLSTGPQATWWGSVWYGGTNSALESDYAWMYEDGPGGGNLDCQTAGAPGCWGHRDNLIHAQTGTCPTGAAPTYFAGAADNPSLSYPTSGVVASIAEITVATCSPSAWTSSTAETYTWAQALAALGTATPVASPTFTTFTRVSGPTADATAAAELEHQFPAGTSCPGTTGTRPVILATDATYPDALASATLAHSLGTGTLLTPTATLSQATIAALRQEGITRVDVVGGPLAVSTTVVQQLKALPAYACGGTGPLATGKQVTVTRIWGQTEYTTAERIAEKLPAGSVGAVNLSGAYAGVSAQGGNGQFNDTAGLGSAGPVATGALPTAILATGHGFQDAEAASTLAYAASLPILLTTPSTLSSQAASTVGSLGIKQVIVMGGPLAVSNAIVTQLQALGVSVLRVAGQTFVDTSVQLARLETAAAPTGFAWAGTGSVTIARGDAFTDGLAGAVVSADGPRAGSPQPLLLTTNPSTVGTPLASFLKTAGATGLGGATVTHFTVLGGALAVTQTTINAMGADL